MLYNEDESKSKTVSSNYHGYSGILIQLPVLGILTFRGIATITWGTDKHSWEYEYVFNHMALCIHFREIHLGV